DITLGNQIPGAYLAEGFKKANILDLTKLTTDQFLELLIQTKKPQIFAESQIIGNGRDWNAAELSILGDVNIAVSVTIFDNDVHRGDGIKNHVTPFSGELLFVPGALLASDSEHPTQNMNEVVKNGKIDDESFYKL